MDVQEELLHEVTVMAERLEKSLPGIHTQPVDVLCCSAQNSVGVDDLVEVIRGMLSIDGQGFDIDNDDVVDWDTSLPDA